MTEPTGRWRRPINYYGWGWRLRDSLSVVCVHLGQYRPDGADDDIPLGVPEEFDTEAEAAAFAERINRLDAYGLWLTVPCDYATR